MSHGKPKSKHEFHRIDRVQAPKPAVRACMLNLPSEIPSISLESPPDELIESYYAAKEKAATEQKQGHVLPSYQDAQPVAKAQAGAQPAAGKVVSDDYEPKQQHCCGMQPLPAPRERPVDLAMSQILPARQASTVPADASNAKPPISEEASTDARVVGKRLLDRSGINLKAALAARQRQQEVQLQAARQQRRQLTSQQIQEAVYPSQEMKRGIMEGFGEEAAKPEAKKEDKAEKKEGGLAERTPTAL